MSSKIRTKKQLRKRNLGLERLERRLLLTVTGGPATDGNDYLVSDDAGDLVAGDGGNDTIIGNAGKDTIYGDDVAGTKSGNDYIDPGPDSDVVYAGAGDDTIVLRGAEGTNDFINGGTGNDVVITESAVTIQQWIATSVELWDGKGFGIYGDNGQNQLDFSGTKLVNVPFINGLENADTIVGSVSDDSIIGGTGDDSLDGREGNDYITGDEGLDTIIGGKGDDALKGGSQNDSILGGEGNDSIAPGTGTDYVDAGTGNDAIFITDDEGAFDTLIGGEDADGKDQDTLFGQASAGTYIVLHKFDPSNGIEKVVAMNAFMDIRGTEGADTLDFSAVNNLFTWTWVDGKGGDDSLVGTNKDDVIYGGEGNDTINGLAGDDYLDGEAGNDVVSGGDGNDTLWGGLGNDTLKGGEDNDVYGYTTQLGDVFNKTGDGQDVYVDDEGDFDVIDINDGLGVGGAFLLPNNWSPANGIELITAEPKPIPPGTPPHPEPPAPGAIVFDPLVTYLQGTDTANSYDFSKTAMENIDWIDAGKGNDTVIGSAGDDLILGGDGDDSLVGDLDAVPGGDDFFRGGAGNDVINGGPGFDTAEYADMNGIQVDLNTGLVNGASTDTLISIESVVGSPGNDTFIFKSGASDAALTKFTLDGNELNYDGSADKGEPPGDPLTPIPGEGDNDSVEIWGTEGNDIVTVQPMSDGYIEVRVEGGDGKVRVFDLANIEEVTFKGLGGNDIMTIANNGALDFDSTSIKDSTFKFYGGSADDTLNGAGFTPAINIYAEGNEGADLLIGGAGNDSLIGGTDGDVNDGNDTILGNDGNDTIKGGSAADSLLGGAGKDSVDGESGNDNISGGTEDDKLFGGAGNDIISGGNGADTISGGTEDDKAYGDAGNDYVGGDAGNDTLFGDNGDLDNTDGLDGNDTLEGGAGIDTLYGEFGNDTATYANAPNTGVNGGKVHAWLSNNPGNPAGTALGLDGYDAQDHYHGDDIENLIGSNQDDTLVGDEGSNVISGGGGNDLIFGWDIYAKDKAAAEANDVNDTLNGGAGVDSLYGGNGADSITGDAGNDILEGGDGGDSLWGGADVDTVRGGLGNDVIQVVKDDAKYDDMKGGDGVDTLDNIGTRTDTVTNLDIVLTKFDGSNDKDGWQEIEVIDNKDNSTKVGQANWQIIGTINNPADPIDPMAGNNKLDFTDVTLTNVTGIDGLTGNDTIIGSAGADVIKGSAGNDSLVGLGGNDTITGGADNDYLSGGNGADVLTGNLGNDIIYGNDGNDTIDGDESPTPYATGGVDTIFGGAGNDSIITRARQSEFDLIAVDPTNAANEAYLVDQDTLANDGTEALVLDSFNSIASSVENFTGGGYGIHGNDRANNLHFWGTTLVNTPYIDGKGGNDYITGSNNAETLWGGSGNDTLDGWGGNDVLIGGSGNDYLLGYDGADTPTVIPAWIESMVRTAMTWSRSADSKLKAIPSWAETPRPPILCSSSMRVCRRMSTWMGMARALTLMNSRSSTPMAPGSSAPTVE